MAGRAERRRALIGDDHYLGKVRRIARDKRRAEQRFLNIIGGHGRITTDEVGKPPVTGDRAVVARADAAYLVVKKVNIPIFR